MRQAFDALVMLVGVGFMAAGSLMLTDAIASRPWFFVLLWLYLPALAWWLGRVEDSWTVEAAEKTRDRLSLAVLALGMLLVIFGHRAFDDVAEHIVPGYFVEYVPNYVAGAGTRRLVFTTSVLGTAVLWSLRAAALLLVVALPYATYVGLNEMLIRHRIEEALRKREEEEAERESEAFFTDIDSIDVDDPDWESKVKDKLGL